MYELQVQKFWGAIPQGPIEDRVPQLSHGPSNNLKPATWQGQGLSSYGTFVVKDLPTIVLCCLV